MNFDFSPEQDQIRRTIQEICHDFPNEYWRELDAQRSYPEKFIDTLTEGGWLAALIPEEYGGIGVGVSRRKQYVNQRDAIADAMVNAEEEDASRTVILDEMDLP